MLPTPDPRCHIDFATNPYDATRQWTDVTEWLRAFDVGVGRQHELLTFEPQEGEIVFDNRDGRFDPSNTGSPYYPNVLPIRPVRLVSGYKWEVLATNPIAYWRLGEADGATTAVDEMATYNLTQSGGVTFDRAGRIPGNGAADFDGVDDFLTHSAFTTSHVAAFTMAAWVKGDTLGGGTEDTIGGLAGNDFLLRVLGTGVVNLYYQDNTLPTTVGRSISSFTTLSNGLWYFIVGSWDGTRLRIYINGSLDNTSGDLSATPPRDSGNLIRIGARGADVSTVRFDGVIDEPAVWDRALTADEIAKLFEEGDRWPTAITVKDSGPAAHWKLDEAASATTLTDEAGGFTLTKTGAPTLGVEGRLPGIPGNKGVEFFAGASERLQNTAFTLPLNGNVSMAAWVFIDSFSDRYIISKGIAGSNRDFYLTIGSSGRGRIAFFDTGAVARELFTPNSTLTTGRWYFLVGTWDGTFLRIYVDGVLSNTSASLAGITPRDSGDDLRIGAPQTPATTNVWHGVIDDPAIWTRALSAQEIADLYNADVHQRQADGYVWTGFIHEWRPIWESGSDADVACKVFDGTALLPLDPLIHPYEQLVRKHQPNVLLPLSETQLGVAEDISGKGRSGLLQAGELEITFGLEGPVKGRSAIEVAKSQPVEVTTATFPLTVPADAAIVGTGPLTIVGWVQRVTADFFSIDATLYRQASGASALSLIVAGKTVRLLTSDSGGSSNLTPTISGLDPGSWNLLIGVREADGVLRIYWNGTLAASSAALTLRNLLYPSSRPDLCTVNPTIGITGAIRFAFPAVIPKALTASEIADIYAARDAWENDKSDARIRKVLDEIGFPSAERNIEAGQSLLQGTPDLETSALQHLQDVAQTENGIFFAAPDGKLTFFDRHHIFLDSRSVNSQATFGDNPVLSEFPYHLQEGMDPVIDEIDIRNEIHTQRVGGALFIAKDQASIDKYRRRVYDERTSMLAALDNETKAAGEGLLNQYKTPKERVRTFLFTPHSWPDYLFPIMLGAQMWDRIIWKRTPVGSASRTVVEGLLEGKRISWDGETKAWACSLQLNPFAPAPSPAFIWDTSKWDTDAAWVY